jgi:hypothetical protein
VFKDVGAYGQCQHSRNQCLRHRFVQIATNTAPCTTGRNPCASPGPGLSQPSGPDLELLGPVRLDCFSREPPHPTEELLGTPHPRWRRRERVSPYLPGRKGRFQSRPPARASASTFAAACAVGAQTLARPCCRSGWLSPCWYHQRETCRRQHSVAHECDPCRCGSTYKVSGGGHLAARPRPHSRGRPGRRRGGAVNHIALLRRVGADGVHQA